MPPREPQDPAAPGPRPAGSDPVSNEMVLARLAQMEHELADLGQATHLYAQKVADLAEREPELAAVTEGLTQQVENLGGTLAKVNEVTVAQQRITQAQIDLEQKVVLKDAFDDAWKESDLPAVLTANANRAKTYAVAAMVVVLAVVGAGGGWFIHYQLGKNGKQATSTAHTETLNKQRIAACEQKNQALEQGVQAFGSFISQEKALAHPDVVVVEVLELVRLSTQAQIIPCPGASPSDVPTVPPVTPGSTPPFLLTPPPSDSSD